MEDEKKLKILMLEDNEDDAMMIGRILQKDNLPFVSERVDTREEFEEAISRFRPDIILSDHGLPQFNSREALKICLRERLIAPFILVTGTMSDEFAISILKDGAHDYILKSNLTRLPLAIRRAVKEQKLEKLKREARHALRKQNTELLKVNEELDNFVYSVSHNLKGPLASVKGLLHVAHSINKDAEVDSVHGMMDTSILRLDETLNEIIAYSKNARNEIQTDQIDWTALFQESLNKLEYLDKENRIRKQLTLQADNPFASDAGRLITILTNLFSNSLLYRDTSRQSWMVMDVTTTIENAVITVSDNGIGIREEILPRVSDMFYRGTEVSQGAGLGLYIVKEIVSKLKGTLRIESVPDQITTVTITIPNNLTIER